MKRENANRKIQSTQTLHWKNTYVVYFPVVARMLMYIQFMGPIKDIALASGKVRSLSTLLAHVGPTLEY